MSCYVHLATFVDRDGASIRLIGTQDGIGFVADDADSEVLVACDGTTPLAEFAAALATVAAVREEER